jgi:hypothetical protein
LPRPCRRGPARLRPARAARGAVEVYAGVDGPPLPDGGRLFFQGPGGGGVPGVAERADLFAVGLAASFATLR